MIPPTKSISFTNKQRGATLITSLVFLSLMTIVGVSASKISILDVLVAGNEQQRMLLFQETENDLKDLTSVPKLYKPMIGAAGASFSASTGAYVFPTSSEKPHVSEKITDKKKRYSCGGFSGKAVSIGPSVPPCDLYDFQVNATKLGSSAKDRHNRGAGKEKPNPKKDSYL